MSSIPHDDKRSVVNGGDMAGLFIRCARCGEVVGVVPDGIHFYGRKGGFIPVLVCTGERTHRNPMPGTCRLRWGLVEEFVREYPETGTRIQSVRYIGPPYRLLFAIAFLFLVKKRPGERVKKMFLGEHLRPWIPFAKRYWRVTKTLLHEACA